MPQMSKVELYAAIRRDHRVGMTMRELEPNKPQRANPLKPLDCWSGHLSGSASWRFSKS